MSCFYQNFHVSVRLFRFYFSIRCNNRKKRSTNLNASKLTIIFVGSFNIADYFFTVRLSTRINSIAKAVKRFALRVKLKVADRCVLNVASKCILDCFMVFGQFRIFRTTLRCPQLFVPRIIREFFYIIVNKLMLIVFFL